MATDPVDRTDEPRGLGASVTVADKQRDSMQESLASRSGLWGAVAVVLLFGLAYAVLVRLPFGAGNGEIADADKQDLQIAIQADDELHVVNAPNEPTPLPAEALIATLRGHEAEVSALAHSPDGRLLASCSFDGTTKLWAAETGKLLATLGGHSNAIVWSVAFSPDGEVLATAGGDGKILLWSVATQTFLRVLKESDIPAYTGNPIGGPHEVSNICFSPDGKTLAVCGMQHDAVNLWDLETGVLVQSLKLERTGSSKLIPTHIVFDREGNRLAVSGRQESDGGWLALLDVQTGEVLWKITGKGKWMPSVAFSPDGKMLATGNAAPRWSSVVLLDSTDGHLIKKLFGYHDTHVWSIAFSPDGQTLASCGRKLRIWDVASRTRLATFPGHERDATDLLFYSDGRTVASSSTDRDINVWDVPAVIAASRQNEKEEEQQSLAEIRLEPEIASVTQAPVLVHEGFDGKLEQDWQILHSDPSHVSFDKKPGTLTIATQQGGLNQGHVNFNNVFLLENPLTQGEDFTITTCLKDFRPLEEWNQAGLLCFDDEDNYIKWGYEAEARGSRRLTMFSEDDGVRSKTRLDLRFNSAVDPLWLRVTKRGPRYHGSFSLDGKSFRGIGDLTWGNGTPKKVGLIALNGPLSNAPSVDASFDFFEMRKAPPVEQTPDRYAVPEEGAEELLRFIREQQRFRPKSRDDYREHQLKSKRAIKLAAEKILDSETDDRSEAVQAARLILLEDRILALRGASVAEKQEVVRELEAILKSKDSSSLTSSDLYMAMSVTRTLESDNQLELAADACERFARLVASTNDENLTHTAAMLQGSARRLRLIGNELDLKGVQLDGSEFDWSAYRGKVVLVDFWATWCGPCLAEIPNVRKYYDQYHDRGFDVVGISLDRTRKSLTDYLAKQDVPWVTLHDETSDGFNAMAVHYGVMSIPTVLLIDQEGKVVSLKARGAELGKLLNDLLGPIESEETQIEKKKDAQ